MAGTKISQLPTATTPLTGAELVPVVQSSSTYQTTAQGVANLAALPLAASGGSALVGFLQDGTGAVARTVQSKERDTVSVKDFGAVGDGVTDDTAALVAAVGYINSISLNSRPVSLYFPKGVYKSSAALAFIRPVCVYAFCDAVLNYTGTGSSAIKLGPDGITNFDVFLQGEYTVDGLRFTGGANAIFGIYINSYVIEPRIRNCTFEDYGNVSCYDIYSQYEVWDLIIENCRKLTYSSLTAVGSFIAITGRNAGNTLYDAGNSRVTIRDCWMTSYSNQAMGYFAYVNAVKCRIIGGGYQKSNGGILLGPFASATLIDGVYCEISTTGTPTYISTYSASDGSGSYHFPQQVIVRNGYINMHQEVIGSIGRMITANDVNVKLLGWSVENMSITSFENGQPLVVQNDVTGQIGNNYKNIKPLFIPSSSDDGRRFVIRGAYTNAEAWASADVETGTWTPSVGGTATYTTQVGSYSKTGNIVTINFDLQINSIGTGSLDTINGLPYACGPRSGAGAVAYYNSLALSVVSLNIQVGGSTQAVTLTGATTAGSGIAGALNVLGNFARIVGSVTYMTS